ncbi:MAG TPA: PaaI family thioesterase [Candidatus Nanopelagicales bacterium]|nr:PaaI family thioesterase [Candidatus Nanopelagicales bacterium]
MSSRAVSIQEQLYPTSTCFGCGQANANGLRIRSFEHEGGVVAHFEPGTEHSNGMGSLNGGIIATVLDCHSGAAVLLEAARPQGELTDLWVTAGLEIRYRLPTFLEHPSELHARITEKTENSMIVQARLVYEGKTRVQAESRWAPIPRR